MVFLPIFLALTVLSCSTESIVTVVVTPTPEDNPTPIIQTVVVTATPGPTTTPIIQTVVVTATPLPTSTPRPTLEAMPGMMEEVQEISIIENYTATRFWPRNIVVIKDIPVRMYLTRLHREHVNLFTIEPFFSSTEQILPGEIGIIDFIPDQLGEFKISTVGHRFDGWLSTVPIKKLHVQLKADARPVGHGDVPVVVGLEQRLEHLGPQRVNGHRVDLQKLSVRDGRC